MVEEEEEIPYSYRVEHLAPKPIEHHKEKRGKPSWVPKRNRRKRA